MGSNFSEVFFLLPNAFFNSFAAPSDKEVKSLIFNTVLFETLPSGRLKHKGGVDEYFIRRLLKNTLSNVKILAPYCVSFFEIRIFPIKDIFAFIMKFWLRVQTAWCCCLVLHFIYLIPYCLSVFIYLLV